MSKVDEILIRMQMQKTCLFESDIKSCTKCSETRDVARTALAELVESIRVGLEDMDLIEMRAYNQAVSDIARMIKGESK